MIGFKRCFLTEPGGSLCWSDTDAEMCPLEDQDEAGGDGVNVDAPHSGKKTEADWLSKVCHFENAGKDFGNN